MTLLDRYGPWALIAGASDGIGASFAEELAAAGFNLVLVARRPDPLEALAADLASRYGIDARAVAADLTEPDIAEHLAAATVGFEIGLLVYNAGSATGPTRVHDVDVDESLMLVRRNCVGPLVLAHRFGAAMLERGRGGIILMSSVASVGGAALTAVYSATKAFDHVLAEGLWAEMQPQGVDVLALVAGATRTPTMERTSIIGSDRYAAMEPEQVAQEGLAHLGQGPVHVVGEENRNAFSFLLGLPRADLVELMSAGARGVYDLPDPTLHDSDEGSW